MAAPLTAETNMTRSSYRHSYSAFSVLGHFRSLSRAGSRSCKSIHGDLFHGDGHRTLGLSDSSKFDIRSLSRTNCVPPELQNPDSFCITDDMFDRQKGRNPENDPPKIGHPGEESKSNLRPLTWFPFLNMGSNDRLPKPKSRTAISSGMISAPLLTSTTNQKVAEEEKVTLNDFVTSVPQTSRSAEPESRLQRLVKSIKGKKNGSLTDKNLVDPEDESTARLLKVEESTARKKTETMNLCKEKINKLTGHGNIKRKVISAQPLCLPTESSSHGPVVHPTSATHESFAELPDAASEAGSLTRSFTSTIDQFGLQPQMNQGELVKSKSSFFSLRKHSQGIAEEKEPDKQSTTEATFGRTRQVYPTDLESARESTFNLKLSKFETGSNAYMRGEFASGYPRGIDPLRMHGNTGDLAVAPPGVELPDPKNSNRFVWKGDNGEEDEDHLIKNAPIYSPSSGDLTQYNRQTPNSTVALECPEDDETPTRMPAHAPQRFRDRLGIRKSGSMLALFSKAKRSIGWEEKRELEVKKSGSTYFGRHKSTEDSTMSMPSTLVANSQSQPQLRIPPKGSMAQNDKWKRRGIIGMPGEDYYSSIRDEMKDL